MLGYLQLIRPANCLMTAIAVFIGGLLIIGKDFGLYHYLPIYVAMVAAFLITGAGNAINDYRDVEADKINRPKRPIPTGKVSKRGALISAIVLFAAGLFLAGVINWVTFLIAAINTAVLIVYSFHLQNKLLVGNLAVSYLVGSSFLFGGAAMGDLMLPFWLFLLAGLANMSREVVKDVEDMEGDRAGFLKRLTIKTKREVGSIADRFGIGRGGIELRYGKNLPTLAGLFLVLTLAVSPGPYVGRLLGISYLMILIPTDLVFLAAIGVLLTGKSRKKYARTSRMIKAGMFLGLLAFVLGVLF